MLPRFLSRRSPGSARESRIPEILDMSIKLKEMISSQYDNEVVYECPGGPVVGFGIWKEPNCAMQRCKLPAGCVFTEHPHETSFELVAVTKGLCVARFAHEAGRIEKKLGPGQCVYFFPGQKHEFEALEDSIVIGITIPAKEGYPDGYYSVSDDGEVYTNGVRGSEADRSGH